MRICIIKEKKRSKSIIPKQWVLGRVTTIEEAQKIVKELNEKNKRKNINYYFSIGV